jgi:hypothetical protein
MIKSLCMTRRLKKIALTVVLLVAAVRLFGCSSWMVESATTSAEEAKKLAKCAEDEAKKNPAFRADANKAAEAADLARAASDKAAKYADIDELKADAKRKEDEAKAAEAAADAAEAEAVALKPKVEAYTTYLGKKKELADATAEKVEAADKAARSGDENDKIAYDAAQARYVSADRAMPDADVKFKAPFLQSEDPMAAGEEAKKKSDEAPIKRAEAKTLRKEASEAKALVQLAAAGHLNDAIDTAAKNANDAADKAAEAAATIPECNKLAKESRPDFFDPLATIRPHGSDIWGRPTGGHS